MPYLPKVGKLVKSDRRREWQALKAKHSRAIAAGRVKFDAKLGGTLDKYQAQVAVINGQFAKQLVSLAAIQKLLSSSRPLRQLAASYQDRVKGLGGPAEKELTAFLSAVQADCRGWEEVSDIFEGQSGAIVTAAQLKAVQTSHGILDALSQELVSLGANIPMLRLKLKDIAGEADYSRYVGPLTQAQWQQDAETRLTNLWDEAAKLDAARAAVQAEVDLLITATLKFTASSDYRSFKFRAEKFAAGPALAAFQQQARSMVAMLKLRDNHPKQLGSRDPLLYDRTRLSATAAADKAIPQLIAGFKTLP
jgi:hypothetical protein